MDPTSLAAHACRPRDRKPYALVARAGHPDLADGLDARPVRVGDVLFGGPQVVVIAGPCAVETRAQTLAVARAVKAAGAHALRGGAYKPRTSPYDFQGLGERGLEILAEARAETGLPVVTEVIDVRLVELVCRYADCLQIGARSMYNVPLLTEAGKSGLPVLLKRHWSATLTEWLCAAEYVAIQGTLDIILCERGIRSFSVGDYNRNTLDVNVVQAARERTFLPIVVDPSHATGFTSLVPSAARAGVAAGAHGLLVEVLPPAGDPTQALCDGYQSVAPETLAEIIADVRRWQGADVGSNARLRLGS